MDPNVLAAVRDFSASEAPLVVLSGAGISAESGIPTFRGPEGYWTVGSRHYRPEEMATLGMFRSNPEEVWRWYLRRLAVCRGAEPNAAHRAVVDMERLFGDRFLLITQNVDGLHLRAGNTPERSYQIHGNINFVRCARSCSDDIYPIPASVELKARAEPLSDADRAALRCPACGAWARPHVLWFDESYDEELYRFNSSIEAAAGAGMLLIVGTSGATNLPMLIGSIAAGRGALLVDVNPDRNPFSAMAERANGFFLAAAAGTVLPSLLEAMRRDG